jgi:hypothetical protein
MNNLVDPFQPLHAPPGVPAPLVLNVVVQPRREEFVGGVLESSRRTEQYVILSALPAELRQRVITAIGALQAGM